MYIIINELEKDVLREIISIGLARAADSFSTFAKGGVLLDVPDVKIIEPRVLPDVINEYEEIYFVIRSDIKDDLNGKTYLLFTSDNISRIADVCLEEDKLKSSSKNEHVNQMILEISSIITDALANQLSKILKLNLSTGNPVALSSREANSINRILMDIPEMQPFVITIKTQFRKLAKAVELPMLVVFDSYSVSHLLRIIRNNNLYDYKLLKNPHTESSE